MAQRLEFSRKYAVDAYTRAEQLQSNSRSICGYVQGLTRCFWAKCLMIIKNWYQFLRACNKTPTGCEPLLFVASFEWRDSICLGRSYGT